MERKAKKILVVMLVITILSACSHSVESSSISALEESTAAGTAAQSENEALKEQVEAQQKELDALKEQIAALQSSSEETQQPEEPDPEESAPPASSSQQTAASSAPAQQPVQPAAFAPQPAASQTSSAPAIVQNPDGSYSMTLIVGNDKNADGKRPSANGGTTREQAEEYLQYLKEYAESKGMTWTADAKDGGYDPAMETDGKKDFKADIRSEVDSLIRNDRSLIYAELQESSDVENEWDIIVYR